MFIFIISGYILKIDAIKIVSVLKAIFCNIEKTFNNDFISLYLHLMVMLVQEPTTAKPVSCKVKFHGHFNNTLISFGHGEMYMKLYSALGHWLTCLNEGNIMYWLKLPLWWPICIQYTPMKRRSHCIFAWISLSCDNCLIIDSCTR